MNFHRMLHEARKPPKSGAKGARRGLLLRDALFAASYACLVIAADAVQHPLAWLGFALLLLRTWLKPSKTFWGRAA